MSNRKMDFVVAVYGDDNTNYNVDLNVVVVVAVVVCFQYLTFRLSSQLKAASCAWCSLFQ